MLINATVLIPQLKASPARPEEWPYIHNRACAIFGGCTWGSTVLGGWVPPESDDPMTEPMIPLSIAVDSLGDLALVVAFAREVGEYLGEQEMFVCVGPFSESVKVGG